MWKSSSAAFSNSAGTRGRAAGGLTLMLAQNPVSLITGYAP